MTLSAASTLARARAAIDKHVVYRLGAGGLHPEHALPCDKENRCDCSGFALWALGVSRFVQPSHPWIAHFPPLGGQFQWIDTSRIVQSARGGLPLAVVDNPSPGDLIVYGDKDGHEGHVGIVGQLGDIGGAPISVIHCSAGNMRRFGDAIKETAVENFWKARGALYVRPLDYGAEALGGADTPSTA